MIVFSPRFTVQSRGAVDLTANERARGFPGSGNTLRGLAAPYGRAQAASRGRPPTVNRSAGGQWARGCVKRVKVRRVSG
jgi:hypothetical protein